MEKRHVFSWISKSDVPKEAEPREMIVILICKHDGKYKSRIFYNDREHKLSMTENHSPPRLKQTTLALALAAACQNDYEFKTAEIFTAYLHSRMPPGTLFCTGLPEEREKYS